VYYSDEYPRNPVFVLDSSYAKLSKIERNSNGSGYKFRLSRNEACFDFHFVSQDEAMFWRDELKSFCILNDFADQFELIYLLGKGAFASVYLFKRKSTSERFAIKGFSKKSFNKANSQAILVSEINMMREMNHPNLIKLYEVHETDNSIYLVMEYTTGQTLKNVFKKKELLDSESIEITKSILSALSYFESHKIMHRDLKPDNILVDDDLNVKIIDFGLAAYYNSKDFLHDRCGTAGYIAPEVFKFNRKNPFSAYNDRCDVFSAGCILFQMLFGFRMFEGDYPNHTLKLNSLYCQAEASDHFKKYFLEEIEDTNSKVNKRGLELLIKLVEPDHKKRISAFQALNHQYFEGFRRSSKRNVSFKDTFKLSGQQKSDQASIPRIPLELDNPKSITKCLLSFHFSDKSPSSTDRRRECFTPQSIKNTKNCSQEEGFSPKTAGSTSYGTSIGREMTFEKMCAKQTGKSQRTSLFSNMRRKEENEEEEQSENIKDEEGDEELCTIDESLKIYKRLVSVNKPREMMLSPRKSAR